MQQGVNTYTNIVFDLDGTLSDPRCGIYNAIHYALNKMGVPTEAGQEFAHFIGAPLQDSFRLHYFSDADKAWMAVESFREYYGQTGLFENELYTGVDELIVKLAEKYHLFVLTNKPKIFADKILMNFGLHHYFQSVIGVDVGRKNESKDDLVPGLMHKHSSFAKGKTLMVGDTEYDIACARKYNWDALAVTYGFGQKAKLVSLSPTHIANTISELRNTLL